MLFSVGEYFDFRNSIFVKKNKTLSFLHITGISVQNHSEYIKMVLIIYLKT